MFAIFKSDKKFNKYMLSYSADGAVKGTIRYYIDGEPAQEEFFLSAGENIVFKSFIEYYLDSKLAEGEIEIVTEFIKDGSRLEIHSFSVEACEVYARKTYYFENEFYKVGVELAWGGGLSCIIDKHAPDGLENLLNRYDTGRLVQQSYYGTNQPPFICGEFMGNVWGYNPVQGGDRTNAKSKLVDLKIECDRVYVKCQPRDWGHEAWYTPSYMENTYILDGDMIRVDNKFTDFSGWEHPLAGQEVPAFYTVSYLGNFWFYDKDKPWQDDELSVRRDLIFWPDDWPRHRFPLPKGDTETWCAWTDDSDWGIGLYVPDINGYVGGRFQFDASNDAYAPSTNYVAPIKMLAIKSFCSIEYSYLICTGKLDFMREKFKQNKDFCKNSFN